jgi:outer membrane protein TolC
MNFFIHRIFHASFAILAVSSITEYTFADQSDTDSPKSIPIELSSKNIVGPLISEALENNPGLRAFDLRYQAARESITSARALPNPKVQLTHFVESIQTRTGPQRQAIQLQQPLPWHGSRARRQEAAQAQAESLWHAYASQQFILLDSIAEKTLEVAYLDKSINQLESNTQLLAQLETIAEERIRSGGNLNDHLRLQIETQRFADQIERLKTRRKTISAELDALLGRKSISQIPEIEWAAPAKVSADLNQLYASSTERNPQIAILRSLLSNQEARERLAEFDSKPEVTLGLNYMRTGDAINRALEGSGKDPWALMVGISLPVWGKANRSIQLAASLQSDALFAQIEDKELHLRADVHRWIAKLEDSQSRIERYENKLIPLARQSREITKSNYRTNRTSISDVIDSERIVIELETQYWRAAADAWIARWKLATLSGGLWLN